MKISLSGILGFSFALITFCAINANAQEGTPNNEIPDLSSHPELNLNEDKTLIFEPERTASPEKVLNKEQILANPSRSTKVKATESASKSSGGKNPEEDALSFNFLYYIIQKFKISDIVEQ
jgi:hypothetical protein